MIIDSPQYRKRNIVDYNEWCLGNLKGDLDEKTAQISLAKFLCNNLGFTIDLLTGGSFTLYPLQEVILSTWFQRNFSLTILARGSGKTTLACIFAALYAIFFPSSKIVIAGPNFRTARRIMDELYKIVQHPKSFIIRQCFDREMGKRTDYWNWKCGDSEICALPLTEGTRGQRGDVLIVDEFLLMSKEMVEKVLFPFLSAQTDQNFKMRVKKVEDKLIAEGKMKEEERIRFDSYKKMICLSTASYQFEYLYELYEKWKARILNEFVEDDESNKSVENATYFIAQLSYEALPDYALDKNIIQEAMEGSENTFKREFESRFLGDSDSYFSAKKMTLCTIKDGMSPCIELQGDKSSEYFLSIDPNNSASSTSDHFAISLIKLDREIEKGILVHQYALAGDAGDLKDHVNYVLYLLNNFNIIYIICDHLGGPGFIKSCNESIQFKEAGIYLDFIMGSDIHFKKDSIEEFQKAKSGYNLSKRKIVHSQFFDADFIRKSNELLQSSFDHKRILFASKICPNDEAFKYNKQFRFPAILNMPLLSKERNDESKMLEYLSWQDDLMDLVRKECALIELTTTPMGAQSFDLPRNISKNHKNPNRMRKDSYTALLLGSWGIKTYLNFMKEPEKPKNDFTPIWLG